MNEPKMHPASKNVWRKLLALMLWCLEFFLLHEFMPRRQNLDSAEIQTLQVFLRFATVSPFKNCPGGKEGKAI